MMSVAGTNASCMSFELDNSKVGQSSYSRGKSHSSTLHKNSPANPLFSQASKGSDTIRKPQAIPIPHMHPPTTSVKECIPVYILLRGTSVP